MVKIRIAFCTMTCMLSCALLWTFILVSPAFPMLIARSQQGKSWARRLMRALTSLCSNLMQSASNAAAKIHGPPHAATDPQSLFHLRHQRSCAACALGCRGGQCCSSRSVTWTIGNDWLNLCFDVVGSIASRAVDFTTCMVVSSLYADVAKQTQLPLSCMAWQAAFDDNPLVALSVHCGA